MKTVKTIVKSRLKEKKWGPYDLAKAVRDKMTPQTIYNFLNRKSELSSKNLAFVLDALDLEIRPKGKQ